VCDAENKHLAGFEQYDVSAWSADGDESLYWREFQAQFAATKQLPHLLELLELPRRGRREKRR